jgi:hypothetical protein
VFEGGLGEFIKVITKLDATRHKRPIGRMLQEL